MYSLICLYCIVLAGTGKSRGAGNSGPAAPKAAASRRLSPWHDGSRLTGPSLYAQLDCTQSAGPDGRPLHCVARRASSGTPGSSYHDCRLHLLRRAFRPDNGSYWLRGERT
jgi:hypothetical protein